MSFQNFSFGSIRIDGTTYEHDVVIDRGEVRKRKKKPSKKFRGEFGHTPLSIEEAIPWECRWLVIGTGTGALPVMKEVKEEAKRRKIKLLVSRYLIRLETRAEEIPPDLDCREVRESVTYGRLRLGVSERLLPSGAELALANREGREGHNTIAFSKCRHYTAETSISYSTPADSRVGASAASARATGGHCARSAARTADLDQGIGGGRSDCGAIG